MNKLILLTAIIIFVATSSFLINNEQPTPRRLDLPSNFPKPTYDISNNPITEEGFALGRYLFYDGWDGEWRIKKLDEEYNNIYKNLLV